LRAIPDNIPACPFFRAGMANLPAAALSSRFRPEKRAHRLDLHLGKTQRKK
jgi:hypothetical protein